MSLSSGPRWIHRYFWNSKFVILTSFDVFNWKIMIRRSVFGWVFDLTCVIFTTRLYSSLKWSILTPPNGWNNVLLGRTPSSVGFQTIQWEKSENSTKFWRKFEKTYSAMLMMWISEMIKINESIKIFNKNQWNNVKYTISSKLFLMTLNVLLYLVTFWLRVRRTLLLQLRLKITLSRHE